jgi:arylsulfatase A-like enzyme
VLLVVLDTVRADRLSLYGYERPTSPQLQRLAQLAIRFDEARATAPWTLASHASFFTGLWPHQLAVDWMTPVRWSSPTLADYLGSIGYATAGFAANVLYCSYDTHLDQGFTHFEDYDFGRFGLIRSAWLGDRGLQLLSDLGVAAGRGPAAGLLAPLQGPLFQPLYEMDRKKDAGAVNREFLGWLSRRPQPSRPFFAFLNYYDTHAPYVLPSGAPYRFGIAPRDQSDFMVLVEHWQAGVDKLKLPPHFRALARDSYDNCLAYLDERLGELFDELQRRGELDRTLVVVTADHGEGLGEHDIFDHGESLYRTETRVPLLIVLPSGARSSGIVAEPVSLRDLPATIVDLAGLAQGSPFPGRSLAGLWRPSPDGARATGLDGAMSELRSPNPSDPSHGRSPAHRGPLASLAEGDYVYIRNEVDGAEELFDEREDSRELTNRAGNEAMRPLLSRFRARLERLRASPDGSAR